MLGYDVIDKDDLLEASFATAGTISPEVRADLSRKADTLMRKRVELRDRAVLVSFWRRPELSATSGTLLVSARDRSTPIHRAVPQRRTWR
jgi:hypothetical protein